MNKFLLITIIVCGFISSPAFTENIKEKKIVKGEVTIESDMGYIFVSGVSRQAGVFYKEPTEKDLEEYNTEKLEEFDKAHKKYLKNLKRWKSKKEQKVAVGPKPIEPVLEQFSIGPIELRHAVSFGYGKTYLKDKSNPDKPHYSYLMSLEPGIYTFAGPVVVSNDGYFGHCYCMGSVKFEVTAGEITNLGNYLTNAPLGENGGVSNEVFMKRVNKSNPKGQSAILGSLAPGNFDKGTSARVALDFELPVSLSQYSMTIPEFYAAGKMNNHYGVMINRIAPIEGVIRYDRDTIISMRPPNDTDAIVTVGDGNIDNDLKSQKAENIDNDSNVDETSEDSSIKSNTYNY